MRRVDTIRSRHPKVPRKLWKLYKVKYRGNCARTARELDINPAHVWKLLSKGIEPTRIDLRQKLFLRVPHPRKPVELPEYIKRWRHLPTGERREVIRRYIEEKEK